MNLSAKTIEILNDALRGVVNEPGGQVRMRNYQALKFAAKRELHRCWDCLQNEKARRRKILGAFQKDHALFACYAPSKSPEIAIAVILENAGGGGAVAAPVARKILTAYFEGKKKDKQPKVVAQSQPAMNLSSQLNEQCRLNVIMIC